METSDATALAAMDGAIREAAASMGLVAVHHLTRSMVEALIATANAADWSGAGILAHEDRLVDWDAASQSGTIVRTLTLQPAPQNVPIQTSYTFGDD